MSLKRQRNHQPTPFQLKKEIRGGNLKKRQRGRLVGRVQLRWTGGAAQITFFAGNGFGFRRKIAPRKIAHLLMGFFRGIYQLIS